MENLVGKFSWFSEAGETKGHKGLLWLLDIEIYLLGVCHGMLDKGECIIIHGATSLKIQYAVGVFYSKLKPKHQEQRPKNKDQRPKTKDPRPKTQAQDDQDPDKDPDKRPKTQTKDPRTKNQDPRTKTKPTQDQDPRPKNR